MLPGAVGLIEGGEKEEDEESKKRRKILEEAVALDRDDDDDDEEEEVEGEKQDKGKGKATSYVFLLALPYSPLLETPRCRPARCSRFPNHFSSDPPSHPAFCHVQG